MKQRRTSALLLTLLLSVSAQADTVREEVVDTIPGNNIGGLSGFLLGGLASGGPVGALVGGGIGWLVGGKTQAAAGLGDTAYRVETDDGTELTVRSPGQSWLIGDEVRVVGNRLVPRDSVVEL